MAKCSRKPRFSDFGHRHVQFQRLPVAHSFFSQTDSRTAKKYCILALTHSNIHTHREQAQCGNVMT